MTDDVTVQGPSVEGLDEVLTPEAEELLADLHRRFEPVRQKLLDERPARRVRVVEGRIPETPASVREGDWQVAPPPEDLQRRNVEITGPTDRKMMIYALNSGADVFMADFEDANSPTWSNMIQGQRNLRDAVRDEITFTKEDGTTLSVEDDPATLMVRPRGWHLDEPNLRVDGDPIAGGLVDVGLYVLHNAEARREQGSGTYLYLPKLESRQEAALWDDVFSYLERRLDLPEGTIRATVLIEHLQAALQMEAILHDLKDHSAGLNAGRWDYIFSLIKVFRDDPDRVLPDRAQVTMTTPFMRAYAERLVQVCHRRGAHAIGGMAAFIPRGDPEVDERAFAEVRQDKRREVGDGFDGTWVAHPALVEVVREIFDDALDGAPHQIDRTREDVDVDAEDLIDLTVEDGRITEEGLRQNVGVGIRYLDAWLAGNGAAAIFDLMEDTATAEISRAQVWQWVHHEVELEEGGRVTATRVRREIRDAVAEIRDETDDLDRLQEAAELFETVATGDELVEFLTLPGMTVLRDTPQQEDAT